MNWQSPAQPISSRKEKRNGLLDNANYDKRLFMSCALRKQIAEDEEVPPHVVFNDATLVEMAQLMPMTEEEMLAVNRCRSPQAGALR